VCAKVLATWTGDLATRPVQVARAALVPIAASQFNFSRLSDWANYRRASHGSGQLYHESYDALVPRLRGANERTWSRFPVRAMPPNHHLLRCVGCLALFAASTARAAKSCGLTGSSLTVPIAVTV
jgi:hypothetical protein